VKYSVITFGCRVNQADSLGFEEELRANGAIWDAPDQADVVIVNTCSVTASADQGARQTVRRLARTNPAAKVVVTGCYATRRPEEFRDAHNVLRVVTNDEKSRLVTFCPTWAHHRTRRATVTAAAGGHRAGVAGRTAFTLASVAARSRVPTALSGDQRGAAKLPIAEVLRKWGAGRLGFKDRHHRRPSGIHGRDLTLPLRSSSCCGAGAERPQPLVRFRISSLEPMDCSPRSSTWSPPASRSRLISTCRCSTPATAC
jgi:hypothetical protein